MFVKNISFLKTTPNTFHQPFTFYRKNSFFEKIVNSKQGEVFTMLKPKEA